MGSAGLDDDVSGVGVGGTWLVGLHISSETGGVSNVLDNSLATITLSQTVRSGNGSTAISLLLSAQLGSEFVDGCETEGIGL